MSSKRPKVMPRRTCSPLSFGSMAERKAASGPPELLVLMMERPFLVAPPVWTIFPGPYLFLFFFFSFFAFLSTVLVLVSDLASPSRFRLTRSAMRFVLRGSSEVVMPGLRPPGRADSQRRRASTSSFLIAASESAPASMPELAPEPPRGGGGAVGGSSSGMPNPTAMFLASRAPLPSAPSTSSLSICLRRL